MADSTWNVAFPAAVFGPDVVQNVSYDAQLQIKPSEVLTLPVASSTDTSFTLSSESHSSVSSAPSASQSTTTSRSQSTSRSTTSRSNGSGARSTLSAASEKRKAEPTERRNKFIPIQSPIMPVELQPWITASRMIGETFDNKQPERPGVPRKYVLPEPSLFAGHSNEGARQAMLKTFLKVREVLYYDIFTRGAMSCLKYPAEWRRMMGLELHGQKSDKDTHESRLRKKLRMDLQMAASSDPSMVS